MPSVQRARADPVLPPVDNAGNACRVIGSDARGSLQISARSIPCSSVNQETACLPGFQRYPARKSHLYSPLLSCCLMGRISAWPSGHLQTTMHHRNRHAHGAPLLRLAPAVAWRQGALRHCARPAANATSEGPERRRCSAASARMADNS